MNLSQKRSSIAPSLTLEIDAKAKQLSQMGYDVIGFGAGEPDFDTPEYICKAAKAAIDKGLTKYTPVSGILPLKEAICRKFLQDNNLSYEPNQIIVSNGAKHSLFNVFQALLNPNDEVLIPSPYWLSYPEMVLMADGIPVFVKTYECDNFKLQPKELLKLISSRTKALVINSPNNPTGAVYSSDELNAIADLAVKHNFYVISDEIYEDLVYDNTSHHSIAAFGKKIKDLTITVNGLSKSHAMTGWRIGYAAASREIIEVMTNIQSHSTSNPNTIAQYASLAALNSSKDDIKIMRDEFNIRRTYMIDRIKSIPFVESTIPQGAFYIMMNVSRLFGRTLDGVMISDSLVFANRLLDNANVAVVPGIVFGAEGYLRLSYATSLNNICKGLERIELFISKLV